jgi:hypothetical protein
MKPSPTELRARDECVLAVAGVDVLRFARRRERGGVPLRAPAIALGLGIAALGCSGQVSGSWRADSNHASQFGGNGAPQDASGGVHELPAGVRPRRSLFQSSIGPMSSPDRTKKASP